MPDSIKVIFDGGCPACQFYFNLLRLAEDGVAVEFVDARSSPEIVAEYRKRGIDLDREMVVEAGGAVYVGGDAISYLSRTGHASTLVRRVNAFLFKTPAVARLAYPILRLGRRVLLKTIRESACKRIPTSSRRRAGLTC